MKDYLVNKVRSFTAVLVFLLITYAVYGFNAEQWQVILLAVMVFGYAHFFVGFYYQWKSFARSEFPLIRYTSFITLTIVSIGIAYATFLVFGFAISLLINTIYFLAHGLFSEQTLIMRQMGLQLPMLPLIALTIFVGALLLYSVHDKTFFFDHNLNFSYMNDRLVEVFFAQHQLSVNTLESLFWVGLCGSVAFLVFSWYRYRCYRYVITISALIMLITAGVVIFGIPPYVYVSLIIVGYHFMTWHLFYITEYSRRGGALWRNFVFINLGVFGLLLALLSVHWVESTFVTSIVFDYRYYLVLSFIHFGTSFMNDGWWMYLERKFANVLSHRMPFLLQGSKE